MFAAMRYRGPVGSSAWFYIRIDMLSWTPGYLAGFLRSQGKREEGKRIHVSLEGHGIPFEQGKEDNTCMRVHARRANSS